MSHKMVSNLSKQYKEKQNLKHLLKWLKVVPLYSIKNVIGHLKDLRGHRGYRKISFMKKKTSVQFIILFGDI